MKLSPLNAYRYYTTQGAGRLTALLFTVGTWVAFLLLRLESPAWQALLADRRRLFPQLAGKPPTLGDPLRLVIQGVWLLIRREPVPRAPSALARGWRVLCDGIEALLQRVRLLRTRMVEGLRQVPGQVRTSTWRHDAARRIRGLSKGARRAFYFVLAVCALALALLCVTEPFGYLAQLMFILLLWGIAMLRPDSKHAKAGNLNHALGVTDGELVAIFDCDHVPVRSFLQMTVGWFLKDPRLALVQTPHHFFSPDPFERNLGTFRNRPNEGELFYGLIQDGNDMWNAAFFCGSCAVLRRTALEDIGGFAVETVTEDAHTALRLHRHGWNSAYLRLPQAAGLATESLSAHIGQRIRWARGMVQIFRTDNPLFGRGLTVFQRVCYANAMLHFLAGLPRLVFLTAPLAFLLLHAYIIYAPALMILLYVLPHMIHASLTNSRMQGKYRRTFWGEVYETVLAWYIARPTTVALFAPKKGKFNVTAKGGLMEESQFDWRIAQPYLLLAVLNFVGLGFAVWRLFTGPAEEIGTVIVSSLWVTYNLLIIGAAVAVAAEVRQVRRAHRVQMHLPAALVLENGHAYPCTLVDYSDSGIGLELGENLAPKTGGRVRLLLSRGEREFAFDARVTRRVGRHLGLTFDELDVQQRIDLVHCTFARADAWLAWQEAHQLDRPLQSLGDVLRLGGVGYLRLLEYVPVRLLGPVRPLVMLARWLASFMPRTPRPLPSTNLLTRDAS